MNAWIALPFCFAGFVVLGMAMERHREQLLPARLAALPGWGLQIGGGLLLALGLALCWAQWPASVGLAVWLGVLTFAAMLVGLLSTYAEGLLTRLALGALLAGMLLSLDLLA